MMSKMINIPWAAQDELFAELAKVSSVAALTPEERFEYEETLRVYRDNLAVIDRAYNDGREEGEKKGREEGEKKGREEGGDEKARAIAQVMLSKGFAIEDIAEMTGLTLDVIQNLVKA